jgi:hypothetical protein
LSFPALQSSGEGGAQEKRSLSPALATVPALVTLVAAVAVVVMLFVSLGRGFEWSDEGYYLNWIAHPWDFPASITQFGFVYHPLFALAEGDIVLLRRLNLIATLILAAILTHVALELSRARASHRPRFLAAGLSALPVASLVLVFYRFGPPTPSYNSLNLQSLLTVLIGVVLLQRSQWKSKGGWMLLALGVALCLLAKPTTAVALSILVAACLLFARNSRVLPWRGMLLCAAGLAGLLLLASVLIDGSPTEFLHRLARGRQELLALNGGHSLSLGEFVARFAVSYSWRTMAVLSVVAGGGALLGWFSSRRQPLPPWMTLWGWGILVAGALFSILCLFHFVPAAEKLARVKGHFLALAASSIAGTLAGLASRGGLHDMRDRLVLGVVLFALPFAYAFGTNVGSWLATGNAAFFWFLASLVVLDRGDARLAYVLVAQSLVLLSVSLQLYQPYRQPEPLLARKVLVPVPWQGDTQLPLAPDAAAYASGLAQLAQRSGLPPRAPMIDMTGRHPGALYFLGSKPLGAAWMPGRYPGSEAYALKVLARVPCDELARAWVLAEPGGHRALPMTLLARLGLAPGTFFEAVGSVASPPGEYHLRFSQMLYRPSRPPAQAEAACRQARGLTR